MAAHFSIGILAHFSISIYKILENNGIEMICNENMQIEISDEDAEKIDSIVNELAPAASGDYAIEDIE